MHVLSAPLCIALAPWRVQALFGVAAIGFMCVSVAYNLALPLVFLMIGERPGGSIHALSYRLSSAFFPLSGSQPLLSAPRLPGIMFFLLSAGTTRPNIAKAAGWWGIFTSVLAFYIGMAILFEESWGREILPLFYTKVRAHQSRPPHRCATAGCRPWTGRP